MSTVQIIDIILLIAALVCFLIAAIAGGASAEGVMWRRTNFVALGLACWVVTALIAAFAK